MCFSIARLFPRSKLKRWGGGGCGCCASNPPAANTTIAIRMCMRRPLPLDMAVADDDPHPRAGSARRNESREPRALDRRLHPELQPPPGHELERIGLCDAEGGPDVGLPAASDDDNHRSTV